MFLHVLVCIVCCSVLLLASKNFKLDVIKNYKLKQKCIAKIYGYQY